MNTQKNEKWKIKAKLTRKPVNWTAMIWYAAYASRMSWSDDNAMMLMALVLELVMWSIRVLM